MEEEKISKTTWKRERDKRKSRNARKTRFGHEEWGMWLLGQVWSKGR